MWYVGGNNAPSDAKWGGEWGECGCKNRTELVVYIGSEDGDVIPRLQACKHDDDHVQTT